MVSELVVVVTSPQRRTRKKKQLITPIHDFVGERRVSDMKNRVGKIRSEIEAPTANIEEAMRFRGVVAEIDSWSRSMDTNLCSVFSKPEQVVLSCSLMTPPLAVLRLVLGSAPTERLCQAIPLISEMSFSSTFSSHSAMVNVCVEENKKSLIWIWLVLIAITFCESAIFVARLKEVDNAPEVEDCIRTLEVLSLSILNWKWNIKRWHFQNLRKRIAEMSLVKREYESPLMTLWIVRSAVGHLKESVLSEELSQLLKFMESRLQLSYGRISLMEELCRLISQLDLKADFSEFSQLVLSRLAISDLAEYCDGILSTASSVWFLDTSIEEQQRFDPFICLISSSVDEMLSQGSLAIEVIELTKVEVECSHGYK